MYAKRNRKEAFLDESKFPFCSPKMTDPKKFLEFYTKLRENRYNFVEEYTIYMNELRKQSLNIVCNICDIKNNQYFKLNMETFKIDVSINLKKEMI